MRWGDSAAVSTPGQGLSSKGWVEFRWSTTGTGSLQARPSRERVAKMPLSARSGRATLMPSKAM